MKLHPIQIEYPILDMQLQNEYLLSPICTYTTPVIFNLKNFRIMVKRLPQTLCTLFIAVIIPTPF